MSEKLKPVRSTSLLGKSIVCKEVNGEITELFIDGDEYMRMPEIKNLIEALHKAKEVIRQWHGMGAMDKLHEERMWGHYQHSPEMKEINQALTDVEELNKESSQTSEQPDT